MSYNIASLKKTISIIIPVYNEVEQLGACLQAIAAQTILPDEVIVVDNNSTDGSERLAASYPFVKLLHEPRQGVVYARTRGFNAARGDIIGRIDADTMLPPDWIENVLSIFEDSTISAVSGAAHYYDFALAGVADAIDAHLRYRLSAKLKDSNFLWAANMAMRRDDWLAVRGRLCLRGHMHEDFDLAIHLQELGLKVIYDEGLLAGVSSRRIDSGFAAYVRYTLKSPKTYALHGLRSRRHMYPVLMVCWLAYLPGRLIFRGYDTEQQAFSWYRLLAGSQARVDPTTHVA